MLKMFAIAILAEKKEMKFQLTVLSVRHDQIKCPHYMIAQSLILPRTRDCHVTGPRLFPREVRKTRHVSSVRSKRKVLP